MNNSLSSWFATRVGTQVVTLVDVEGIRVLEDYIIKLEAELKSIDLTYERDGRGYGFIGYGGEYVVGPECNFPVISRILKERE